mmetsp:Transcript_70383/g.139507  ORF Transcript_70383/g.139507 Transcript_70383/m.139507 type:complete len:229 (+) Transcript_70383:784-1470(+)
MNAFHPLLAAVTSHRHPTSISLRMEASAPLAAAIIIAVLPLESARDGSAPAERSTSTISCRSCIDALMSAVVPSIPSAILMHWRASGCAHTLRTAWRSLACTADRKSTTLIASSSPASTSSSSSCFSISSFCALSRSNCSLFCLVTLWRRSLTLISDLVRSLARNEPRRPALLAMIAARSSSVSEDDLLPSLDWSEPRRLPGSLGRSDDRRVVVESAATAFFISSTLG